jgi:HlyD family secretion protein
MSMRGNWFALVTVFAALGCRHAAEDAEEDKPAPAAVTCRPAEAATIEDTIDVTGVIAPPPKLDAIVSSPIAGRVGQVVVEEGDRVAAGALLAVIEDPALPAGSLEAKAAVDGARAQSAAAEQDVARQERLVATGIGARKDLDEARAKQAGAAADLATANAKLGLAGAQLARREIRAPRAGVVLHLQRKVGESVDGTSATPIAEIADISVLELHAQASPAALRPLREGMAATVRPPGFETPIAGTVVRVAPAVDPATLLGLVRITLSTREGIKVGVAATGQITVATRPGIRVPAEALRRSMVGEDEVVVCEGGTAHVRKVAIAQRGEHGIAIKDGLKAGEQVVVDHVLGLQDGQPLVAPDQKRAGNEPTEGADRPAAASGDKRAPDETAGKGSAKDQRADQQAGDRGSAGSGGTEREEEAADQGKPARGSAAGSAGSDAKARAAKGVTNK